MSFCRQLGKHIPTAMKKYILMSVFLTVMTLSFAQNKQTISGTVTDRTTGETLFGVSLGVSELQGVGTVSNEYGFFSLSFVSGSYHLVVRYDGYRNDTIAISPETDTMLTIRLSPVVAERELDEVVVTVKRQGRSEGAQMGAEQLDMQTLNKIPVLFGERDLVKSMQLLPGIKSGGDGNSGFFVRGGSADQNLIILDEATVYNASHLLGFFSTFNSDAVKDAVIYKGTQPAQYGGRLSSALDIHMKEGNKQQLEINGSLGLISSKLSIEGPIVKDKSSFFVSGRRTYADLFLSLDPKYAGTKLYFYDLNAKINYRLGKKDMLYVSGYFGKDNLGLKELFDLDWGNATGTIRWNHIVSERLFSNTSLILSKYNYEVGIERGGSDFLLTSSIQDFSLKQEFQYFPTSAHKIRFGLQTTGHVILPGAVSGESISNQELQHRYSLENGFYITDDWKITSRWSVTAGLRLSTFTVFGPGDFYELDVNGTILDTISVSRGEVVKNYVVPEPRLSAAYQLTESSSLKASYNRNSQYLHLLSNATATSPTDMWIPSSNNVKPEIADQFSLGYFQEFGKSYELVTEVYYKSLQNQLDYKNGADVLMNERIETQLLTGTGRAYGLELLLKKRTGRFSGWISYTLSRTEKHINGINNGNWYPARQDRTHDVSLVLSYDLNSRINISANWVYSTGNAVTFPTGKYYMDQQVVWLYTERNGFRMPAYHRMDLGATFQLKDRPKWHQEITVGLYNVYGRQNAYMVSFRESETDPSQTEIVQTALFRFVPSVTWNFKWK